MKTFKQLQFLFLAVLVLVSCTDDIEIVPLGAYENGFFVVNEGPFGQDKGEISFVSYNLQTVKQDVFKSENNGEILGDVLQSIFMFQDKAFLIVNGSNKIEVVNRFTFKRIATINTGLNNPRHMAVLNGRGYVTNWGSGSIPTDDFVAVINLTNYNVESIIPVEEGPERIVAINNKAYVAHLGGWNSNNKITVINANNTIETLLVGDSPSSMVVYNNALYVLSNGQTDWATGNVITPAMLHKIDLNSLTVSLAYTFASNESPRHLNLHLNEWFYIDGNKVFKANANASNFMPNEFFNATNQGLALSYGFRVVNNTIYILDALNYSGDNGKVFVYNINGNPITIQSTGIFPNGVVLN
jgi:hypothetical protein